jgi:hypothetical protein
MEDLARNKRDLKLETNGWDEAAYHLELAGERAKRTVAATHAAEIGSARNAAKLARERAAQASKLVDDRAKAIQELEPLEADLVSLNGESASALATQTEARAAVEAGEAKLADLRTTATQNSERTRRLERVRTIVALNGEIAQYQQVLDTSAILEAEQQRLSEAIGALTATEDAITRIEEATSELSAAQAGMNAVATTVSFAVEEDAREGIIVEGKALALSTASMPIMGKTTIAIASVGTITIEPQIRNRAALLSRLDIANLEMRAALEAAGVESLSAARVAAAQRKEHVRRSNDIAKELANLAPGNRSKRLAGGLEALKKYLGELRGRLKADMQASELVALPVESDLIRDIQETLSEGARIEADIKTAEAALAGPADVLRQADKKLRNSRERLAGLNGSVETKRADLAASRASTSDERLSSSAEALERAAGLKDAELARKEREEGESLEAIDARIKRLEGAALNHQRSISTLNNEVTRLTALIEANEGAGVEEMLLAAEAEQDRLTSAIAEMEQEAEVLQLLFDTLETAEGEAKSQYLSPVVSRVEPYLKMLLPGSNIILDENLHIAAIQRSGQREDFEVLSGGTKEQLAVLTRLAFAELLLGQGRPATVILDDALAFSDDDRIESMFDVLMRAGENVQIIVLTCRKRLFTRLGASPLEIRTGT